MNIKPKMTKTVLTEPQNSAISDGGNSFHIAGVTGSSPVPPTIKINNLALWKTVVSGSFEPNDLSSPAFTAGLLA